MIGLLLIATGSYTNFIQRLINSADKNFLKDSRVCYFIFTDKELNIQSNRKIIYTKIKHRGFPYITLERYHTFYNSRELFNQCNYLFYIDADSLIINTIDTNILSDRVAVLHSHHHKNKGTPETNINSTAYIDINKEDYNYVTGAFNGGSKDEFIKMCKVLSSNIDKDKNNNIIAIWHDESHLNRYFIDNKPTLLLDRNYMFYQDSIDKVNDIKIIGLKKENSIRKTNCFIFYHNPIIIGICGMVRSGSTYQFNIIRTVLELNGYSVTISRGIDTQEKLNEKSNIHLIKVHHYNQKIKNTCDFIFTTERDFEDARQSLELLHNQTYNDLNADKLHLKMWKKFTDLHQHYLDFRNNKYLAVKEIVRKLEELLNFENKITIDKIIQEVDAIKPTDKEFDEETYLHSNHINEEF